ncbi:GntR family transcriptional regulator [Pedobacter faecalis]|uniref:GntR family transcriptional regulator n=1 Tax=Pedobacter faecalis TaxID=3041495 RepID=UPI00254E1036|nr:GntR family transcriptional regulator [Pedobacter sp. ELA7]
MPKLNQSFWTIEGLVEGSYIDQVYRFIKGKILDGVLLPKAPLPSNRQMSAWNRMHRNTALKVYRLLTEEGWICTIAGRGTFVSETFPGHEKLYKPRRILDKLPVYISPLNGISSVKTAPTPNFSTIGFDTPGPEYAPVWHYHHFMNQHVKRYQSMNQIDRVRDLEGAALKASVLHYLDVIRKFSISGPCLDVILGRGQALDAVTKTLLRPADVVVNTSPQDILLHGVLQETGVVCHSLDMSRPSFVEDLERFLQHNKIKMLYLRPQCSFPESSHLKPEQCAALIHLARSYGFYIVEEDDYHEFWYESKPFEEMVRYDHGGHVIYIGALSLLTPYMQQIRTVVAAPGFIELLKAVPKQKFEFRDLLQERIIADLFSTRKVFAYINRMKIAKKAHLEQVWMEMDNYLHLGVHMIKPSSGLSLWLDFHSDKNLQESMDLIVRANREIPYHPDGARPQPGVSKVRLGFGSWEIQEAQIAAKVLQEKFMRELSPPGSGLMGA